MVTKNALQTLDTMSDEEFYAMLEKGLSEAKSGDGMSVEDAFAVINKSIIPLSKKDN